MKDWFQSKMYMCKMCPYKTNHKRNHNVCLKLHKSVHEFIFCTYLSIKRGDPRRHKHLKHNIKINEFKVSTCVGLEQIYMYIHDIVFY